MKQIVLLFCCLDLLNWHTKKGAILCACNPSTLINILYLKSSTRTALKTTRIRMPRKPYWRKSSAKRGKCVEKQKQPALKKRKVNEDTCDGPNDPVSKVCIQGTYHQGDVRFSVDSLGRQCTCNGLVSLCYLSNKETFTSQDLDFVLQQGDELYLSVVDTLKKEGKFTHNYLELSQLPRQIIVEGWMHNITMLDSVVDVFNTGVLEQEEIHRLYSNVQSALQKSATVLVLLGEYAFSLFRDMRGRFPLC